MSDGKGGGGSWDLNCPKELDPELNLNEINVMNKAKTDFLYATPSFLTGAATVFAVSGFSPTFNRSNTELEADSRAIYSDWSLVGQDIATAVSALERKNIEPKNT
jgi:hypothetical protein